MTRHSGFKESCPKYNQNGLVNHPRRYPSGGFLWHGCGMDLKFFGMLQKTCGGCWRWLGATNRHGYGVLHRRKVRPGQIYAHRYAWFLHTGKIPNKNQFICHRCDTPLCCNPAHLFVGTHKQNMHDMKIKGRATGRPAAGVLNPMCKLNENQVAEIKNRIANKESNTLIAKDYGVTHQLISRIKRGTVWAS